MVLDKQQHKVVFNQNTSILAPEFFAIADPKKQNLFFDTIDLADKSARF